MDVGMVCATGEPGRFEPADGDTPTAVFAAPSGAPPPACPPRIRSLSCRARSTAGGRSKRSPCSAERRSLAAAGTWPLVADDSTDFMPETSTRPPSRPAATNGRVGEDGRFSLPFGAPVSAGEHRIAVQGDGFEAEARVQVTPGEDPQSGAFRTVTTAYGQRIDWLTPGGGLQSTLLLD